MEGNDVIGGHDGSDHLDGGSDNDEVRAGAGDDCVRGGEGDDIVVGGGGSDIVTGGGGSDVLFPETETEGLCMDDSLVSCSQSWLLGDDPETENGGSDTYVILENLGKVVILPDPVGSNIVECREMTAPIVSILEGPDLFLEGPGFLVRILDFNVPGATQIPLEGCDGVLVRK